MIIAIDGPSGAGKSSVSQQVAKELNFSCMDTGAMFRAVAWKATKDGIDYQDADALAKIATDDKITFEYETGNPAYVSLSIDNTDVTDQIRTDEITKAVTPVCKHAKVRAALLEQQREIAAASDYIVDGRDIGTVVFPNADLKIFLVADAEERARRRVAQNEETGIGSTDFLEVLADLERRDYEDSHREVAPLKAAEDAIVIDSTDMTQDEVAKEICKLAKGVRAKQ